MGLSAKGAVPTASAAKMSDKLLKPKCGDCYYFLFVGPDKVCSHPDNFKILKGGPVKCNFYEDEERKLLPTQKQWWKSRLTFGEIKERLKK